MICFKLWDPRALLLAYSFWVVLSHFSVICKTLDDVFWDRDLRSFLFIFNCIYVLNVILCVLGVFHIVISCGKWNKDWLEIFNLTLRVSFFFLLVITLWFEFMDSSVDFCLLIFILYFVFIFWFCIEFTKVWFC